MNVTKCVLIAIVSAFPSSRQWLLHDKTRKVHRVVGR